MLVKCIILISTVLLLTQVPVFSQYSEPCNTDYGNGYVSLATYKKDSIALYRAPSETEKPFAHVFAGFAQVGDNTYYSKLTLAWVGSDSVEDMSPRMIDVWDVSEFALPVLTFSADSAWAKVSLDCRKKSNPPWAWISVADARKAKLKIGSWSKFFEKSWTIVFLCNSMMAFYSAPSDTCRIFPTLAGDSTEPEYWMRVIRTSGAWMLVSLQSPIPWNDVKPTDKFPEVWIKYLDGRGRPRIWYFQE